jgi:hypothetical protein
MVTAMVFAGCILVCLELVVHDVLATMVVALAPPSFAAMAAQTAQPAAEVVKSASQSRSPTGDLHRVTGRHRCSWTPTAADAARRGAMEREVPLPAGSQSPAPSGPAATAHLAAGPRAAGTTRRAAPQ